MKHVFAKAMVLGMLSLGLGGCVTAPELSRGEQIFQNYCVVCHGKTARGDGPIADDLAMPPADLRLLSDRNDGIFPRDMVIETVYGYPGKFHSSVMPEFGPLLEGPKVKITTATGDVLETPQNLVDLAAYLEGIQE